MGDILSTLIYIALLLLTVLALVGVVFGVVVLIFGVIPLAVVNGLMALTARRRRIPIWALPYVGWGVSIGALTLLSGVANFQTNLKYDGSLGDWVGVTLVELALTAAGIALASIAFAKQRSRVYASQAEGMKAVVLPKRAYIYWLIWFIGIFIINVIADTAYIAGLGVDIQGVGPGWIIFIDGR